MVGHLKNIYEMERNEQLIALQGKKTTETRLGFIDSSNQFRFLNMRGALVNDLQYIRNEVVAEANKVSVIIEGKINALILSRMAASLVRRLQRGRP